MLAIGVFLIFVFVKTGAIVPVLLFIRDVTGISLQLLIPTSHGVLSPNGFLQLVALYLAFCAYLAVGLTLYVFFPIDDPFTTSVREAFADALKDLIIRGIPLAFFIFVSTTIIGLVAYQGNLITKSELQNLFFQSVFISPLLLFIDIGANNMLS